MIELFEKSGILSLGSRLRWLSDIITKDAGEIFRLYGLDIKPKWFPVLYVLLNSNDNSVTAIAKAIGQSHPSVSVLIRELIAAGYVEESKSSTDRRSTIVRLAEKGEALRAPLATVSKDVMETAAAIDNEASDRLWNALEHWEKMLSRKTFLARVAEKKNGTSSSDISIIDYRPEHLSTFKRLNISWINSHWSLEPYDVEVLSNPEESILSKGGHILVAVDGTKAVGVVALCRMDSEIYNFELAKLAVDPKVRGKGVGEALCRAALARAKSLGAKRIFLESNTLLKPAIGLYRKLGFNELEDYCPSYARGDIQMEKFINE